MKVRITMELEVDELMAEILIARKEVLAENLAASFAQLNPTVDVVVISDAPANDNVPAAVVPIKKEGTSVPSIKIAA